MTAALPPSEAFVDQIMRAIVNQFFENPQVFPTDGQYVPPRSTPAQVVTARLLNEKQGELLEAIMERIDVGTLADQVAERVVKLLTAVSGSTRWNPDPDDKRRADLQKAIDARLVELMAQDMFDKMQAAGS